MDEATGARSTVVFTVYGDESIFPFYAVWFPAEDGHVESSLTRPTQSNLDMGYGPTHST